MTRMLRIALLLAILGGFSIGNTAAAQTNERCFPQTNFCISGSIRTYWERNGGLAVFGYPISPIQKETVEGQWSGPVQWFERDRLEDHTNDGHGVLAGRLGARSLALQGIIWQTLPHDTAASPGCRFFRETQVSVCQPFLGYWDRNGGLERFGLPLMRPSEETIAGTTYTVQYFERRRMERHPEHAGTPFDVQLGLLGSNLYSVDNDCQPWFFSPAPILCPLDAPIVSDGAVQRFEHGAMIWRHAPDSFTIVHDDGRYWIVSAPYHFADIVPESASPPPNRYAPASGFGDIWRGRIVIDGPSSLDEPLRNLLGWAIEPERGATIAYQCQRARAYAEQRCYLGSADGLIVSYGPNGGGIVR